MPELPEVETIRRGLQELASGKMMSRIEVVSVKLIRPPVADPEKFVEGLEGRTIQNVNRRGKYLIFELDKGYALVAHMKMRGSFRVVGADAPDEPYLGMRFGFDSGTECRYHDMWGWGEFRLISNQRVEIEKWLPGMARMGKEPFDEGFGPAVLQESAARRGGSSIKAFLLDQDVLAGVGNIYADETLFISGIHPGSRVSELGEAEWSRIAQAIVAVLTEAAALGGTRSDEFANVKGERGAYVPRVYGRSGQPCVNCGMKLERTKITGRGTVYCPNCQLTGA
ncbi:MAG: bifunctional DNA-formamidopyrimidine glycosylase/DNA-(apurinic or apyrimidinic site) lyase [Capsulimonadaceae bacterium]|nr:bifunctional DNA-formamidopyrimidine glycosylase/DNA-(apurinic or apyrimidinic site) lyase [Capsulimonadaceae bacterium]